MGGEWLEYKIGDLGRVVTGKTPSTKKPKYFDGPYPFITIPDIGTSVYISKTARTLSEFGAATMNSCRLPKNSVLMSCIATIGKCGITSEESFTNQQINSVICDTSKVHPRFLYYVFTQLGYELDAAGAGGSVYTNVSKSRFSNISVTIPPLTEQRAISHILGSLDDKIELNRRMNETLESMARAIFKSWFVDFDPVHAKAEGRDTGLPEEIAALFPDSFEDSELGRIPRGWEISTVGSEFNLTMGQSPPGETYNEEENGLPFFQGRRDFGFRYPTNRVYCTEPKRLAEHDDTLVSVRAPVGEINMAMERCCIGRGVAGIRHNTGSRSYTYYGIHTLKDRFARYEAEGTVFGAINKKQFEGLPWISPPPEMIWKFEQITSPLDEHIKTNTKEMGSLTSIRDTLLPKLISCELRVPDAEKFIEEAGL